MFSLAYFLVPVTVSKTSVYVGSYGLMCVFSIRDGTYHNISTMVLGLLLICTVLVSNIIILVIAARHGKSSVKTGRVRPSRAAVITISCICWAYLLSYAPVILLDVVIDQQDWTKTFSYYMLSINSIVNPIIYTITNVRFRRFMLKLFGLKCSFGSTKTKSSQEAVSGDTPL